MNHIIKKLVLASVAVVVSVILTVAVTYAWTTLSSAPEAAGIQISIGGGNTILLAPDLLETVNGEACHYPGNFNDTLVFSKFDSYRYLNELDALKPVSTADGLHWFVPSYYDITDNEVKNGTAYAGQVKPIDTFTMDKELLYANLNAGEAEKGHYVYLDFWVVSPKVDYVLRVSRGDEDGGSYLIDLPSVNKNEDGVYYLDKAKEFFSASARIGFLVNTNYLSETSISVYQNSRYYNRSYQSLAGAYQEKGEYAYAGDYRFHIYEPNADLDPASENARYVITKPIGLVSDKISLVNTQDRLSVQLRSKWTVRHNNRVLDEMFTTFMAGKTFRDETDAERAFYGNYLQGQVAPYVSKGAFISNTTALYDKCADADRINATDIAGLRTSGATEDQYITQLKANVPQRIRMYVWIEGQDADCTQSIKNARFALNLELAGGNR